MNNLEGPTKEFTISVLEAEVPILSTLIDVDMILPTTTDTLKAMMTKSLSFDVVRIQANKN